LNGPECEPSRSAKSSRSLGASSPSIGRMSPATPTLESYQDSASGTMATQLAFRLFAEASPAKISVSPERALGLKASAVAYGESTPDLLATFDPNTSSWRTSQHCLIEGLTEFSETWPRSGTMRNGIAYQLPPLVRLTDATESGLWPTPMVPNGGRSVAHVTDWRGRSAYHNGQKVQVDLAQAVKMWPTPTARDYRGGMSEEALRRREAESSRGVNLSEHVQRLGGNNGMLNPMWVAWLMGFPIEWASFAATVTRSSRKSRS
jgi:hypothetical protein